MKQTDIDRIASVVIDRIGHTPDIIDLVNMIDEAPIPLAEAIEKALNDAGFYRY